MNKKTTKSNDLESKTKNVKDVASAAKKKADAITRHVKRYESYVVGIGASAGGLEALQKLLAALPANTGFPYIIVQHLSPDYKSLLSEILGKYTEMPVVQVEDGMAIEPNCVYIIQPGKNMILSNGKLLLSSQKERELNLPINMFFRSLAEEAGSQAIAIVLSGTGSDGTNGIKAIKENDGMILVQDVETSKFDGMPRSAMRTGVVDAQLSPEKIALELVHIAQSMNNSGITYKTEKQIDEEMMKKIYVILKKVSNINFTHYKQTTILRRIERRMMLTHMERLEDYVNLLYNNSDEVKTLSKEVLIGVTSFFRDADFFQTLKEKAVTDIVKNSISEEPIRVWVAGCSTGEEAYSIAILFSEVLESMKLRRAIKIFATDLDVEAVTTAGKGIYSDSIIDTVSAARLAKYFTKTNNGYSVNREIRKMIVFSPHNVFQDPPFGRLDLISCRNMLIYFQPVLQNDLFNIFHASLKENGYLFLGKSEAIGAFTDAFPVVDAAAKIFSHNRDVKIPGAKLVPYIQSAFIDDDFSGDTEGRFGRLGIVSEISSAVEEPLNIALLEQFMPACLIVNAKNEIVHTYGENNNYVHISLGKFSNIVFDVITDSLKVPISTILKESREKKQKIQYSNIFVKGEHDEVTINLTAMPIGKKIKEEDETLYALVFSEIKQRGETADAIPYEIDRIASRRITDLEQDLSEVQGKLDKSVAEQECVNEELQAANEELLTANEELQSSNEELQSVNEELYTVNSEYQQKLTELADLNDDIANFLSSTLIGIIFVDNKLNIRRYTDYVTTEFSVMDHDIGRSLKFISYHFPLVDISEICDNVLKSLVPDEREVVTSKKKVFFMRVAPYRSTENKIMGCVITLVDITTQKQGLVRLQSTEEKLSMVQQVSEAKSDYLSRIAHEIRTPMGVLAGLAKIARRQADNKDELFDNLDKISDTVDYMASIVTDIAEAAKSERIEEDNVAKHFSLRSMLDSVQNIINKRAEDAGISFEVSINDDFNPTYIGNETALQQILINFLNNSVKYTKKGGAISLKVMDGGDAGNNKAILKFIASDTGIGIDKSFIPQLFKPFTRESKTDDEGNSMGLGLSIAYNLIKSMDGDVSVESEIGKGSTFTITVKLFKDLPVMNYENAPKTPTDYNLKGCNVLIAEDNAMNRMILGALLKHEQITFVEAEDGEQAVKAFMEAPAYTFDCILMDMRMPNVDGIKATMMIRDSGKKDANSIPIIGVSANGFPDDIKQALKAGLNSYTPKPIDRDVLLGSMKELIKRK